MTSKDYVLIARVLSRSVREGLISPSDGASLVQEFAIDLKHDNPRFDFKKFADACKK